MLSRVTDELCEIAEINDLAHEKAAAFMRSQQLPCDPADCSDNTLYWELYAAAQVTLLIRALLPLLPSVGRDNPQLNMPALSIFTLPKELLEGIDRLSQDQAQQMIKVMLLDRHNQIDLDNFANYFG